MTHYDVTCRKCPRLATFLDEVKVANPGYFCRPVPPFGASDPQLLIVGLAPGLHGANRTGRPFTGDHAGILLYETLFRFGFATRPVSESVDDGLELVGCRISNAVKCLPPQNKPLPLEIKTCNAFLAAELADLSPDAAILALGLVAHSAVLMAFKLKRSAYTFGHGARHNLPDGRTLFDSYHCSRYNTQTRRLTAQGFGDVFTAIRIHLENH